MMRYHGFDLWYVITNHRNWIWGIYFGKLKCAVGEDIDHVFNFSWTSNSSEKLSSRIRMQGLGKEPG